MNAIGYIFQYVIFFYSAAITLFYIVLSVLGYINIAKKKLIYTQKEDELLNNFSTEAPGISVVAGAFNEEVIIIDSVQALLGLQYPNFEVIIVNDGSKDSTLDLLIKNFELEETPFPYIERIRCRPVKRIFKSVNPEYSRLIVLDKVNGGTKADAMNAGINAATFNYFINTDVDCILHPNTLARVIIPVLDSETQVIAVGATMRMVNGCEVEKGVITRVRPPRQIIPTFQETEYLRSYLVAKMGWSSINAVPNVSGGFGLFDKSVVIGAGGYDPLSHAEDMDMTLRMVAYMYDNKKEYLIRQIPDSCCWTEGPASLRILNRQRTRWGRGLLQIFVVHRRFLFNRRYGRMGLLIMPYALLFEFLAPLIEFVGIAFMIFLLFTNQINFNTFWLMLLYVYLIGVSMSLTTIAADLALKKWYKNYGEYLKLIFFSFFEAFAYHPFIVIFTLRGYLQFLSRRKFKWGIMTRQGYTRNPSVAGLSENIQSS